MKKEEIEQIEELIHKLMDEKITDEMMFGTKSMEMWKAIQEAIEEFVEELEKIKS